MQKIPIVLTLASVFMTAMPYSSYAEKRVACGTPFECYQKALEKLEQARELVKAQQAENERLLKEQQAENQQLVQDNKALTLANQQVVIENKRLALENQRVVNVNQGLILDIQQLILENQQSLSSQGWKLLYEHDSNGKRVQGNLKSLRQAIRHGADVKVSFNGNSFFLCERTTIQKGGIVDCVNTSHISRKNAFGFQDNAYHWFVMVNTEGKRDMSRWSVGEHTDRGHSNDTTGLQWFARIR